MWPALLGGCVGTLLGVVAALWFRYKLAQAEGAVHVLREKGLLLAMEKDRLTRLYDEAVIERASSITAHAADLARRDVLLKVHTKREEELNELLRKYKNDPVLAVARLGGLFKNKGG